LRRLANTLANETKEFLQIATFQAISKTRIRR